MSYLATVETLGKQEGRSHQPKLKQCIPPPNESSPNARNRNPRSLNAHRSRRTDSGLGNRDRGRAHGGFGFGDRAGHDRGCDGGCGADDGFGDDALWKQRRKEKEAEDSCQITAGSRRIKRISRPTVAIETAVEVTVTSFMKAAQNDAADQR